MMERTCDGANLGVLQAELAQRLHKMLIFHVQQVCADRDNYYHLILVHF